MFSHRASTGIAFHIDTEVHVLLNAGGGTAVRFSEAGISPSTIDIALFSHFHADHTSAFPAILKSSYFQSRGDRSLEIYGPSGTERIPDTTTWIEAYFDDDGLYRYLYELVESAGGGTVDLTAHDIDTSISSTDLVSVLTRDSFDIKAIPAHHGSAPTLAHQVNSDDSSITVATDISSTTDNHKCLTSGTDVLIHGATISRIPRRMIRSFAYALRPAK